jgi:hypothetical protein
MKQCRSLSLHQMGQRQTCYDDVMDQRKCNCWARKWCANLKKEFMKQFECDNYDLMNEYIGCTIEKSTSQEGSSSCRKCYCKAIWMNLISKI